MYSPHLIMNTMREFKCSAVEAQQWLSNSSDKAFLFSSGEVYIPMSWGLNKTQE